MMAGVIFVFSAAALLQFFVSYCRSLIAASLEAGSLSRSKGRYRHPEDRFWR